MGLGGADRARAVPAQFATGRCGGSRRCCAPTGWSTSALRTGPYGVLRRRPRRGLDIGKVKRARHGIDLGPLEPRLPGILRTPGKRVQLAPPSFLAEAASPGVVSPRNATAARADGFDLVLIGRRQLRSNNSWMHNCSRLMKGADRCTALRAPRRRHRSRPPSRPAGCGQLGGRDDHGAGRGLRRDAAGGRLDPPRLRTRTRRDRMADRGGYTRGERQRHHRPQARRSPDRQRRVQRRSGPASRRPWRRPRAAPALAAGAVG